MRIAIVCVCLLVLSPAVASAHKLNVFASATGATIHGRAYFSDGSPARNVEVIDLDPAGREILRTTTDQQGNFQIQARSRCDHRLLVQTADGHGGEYKLPAAELPQDLPLWNGAAPAAPVSTPAQPPPAAEGSLAEQIGGLERQIGQLREQLAAYEAKIRFCDVLGGIGYILGLAGIACYVLAIRRR
ncbi:MAG: hypothetical protein ABSG68_24080 [Thermoguttaceae bacterium]|jgi:nickel transport protein